MVDWFIILAQAPPPAAHEEAAKAVGLMERLIAGGVPLICLFVALVAVLAAIFQYRKNAELETSYRVDLDARAKAAEKAAEARVSEAKTDAKDRATELATINAERLRAEKETDATIAAAVRVIEKNGDVLARNIAILERVERRLGGS